MSEERREGNMWSGGGEVKVEMCCMREEPIFNKKKKNKIHTNSHFHEINATFFIENLKKRRRFCGAWWCVPLIQALGSQGEVCLCALKAAWIIQESQGLHSVTLSLKKMFLSVLNIYFL